MAKSLSKRCACSQATCVLLADRISQAHFTVCIFMALGTLKLWIVRHSWTGW